ncbi:ribosomal protein S18-alanine N-acetyltransferase [Calidifontibacillus oryziterrae]|uniref:ribosomal protein S18-alanine N-acetyltransferase n=1 Tax=Calidifontibacillus oryziterrae TaxID=1191699 RepID=UPI0002E15AB6|nr:ribosomal protein S18-alanine N-acetyltransferase [Calidifontibacillus oryziterrae]
MEDNVQVQFRLMALEDVEQVYEVETSAFSMPWSKEAFFNELTNNKFAKYIVMVLDSKIIGYCGLWIILDEVHITNIAVLPECRGKKLGDALLKQVIEFCRAVGAKTMSLEVRISNHVAQNLYKKYGFKEGGIRKSYYVDNNEDAIVMWVNINE